MDIENAKDWRGNIKKEMQAQIKRILNNPNAGAWSENYITSQLLMAVGISGTDLFWRQRDLSVKWAGFKLNGTAETDCGDIAVIVEILRNRRNPFVGFAYYEAKRMYYNEDGFPMGYSQLKQAQLSRLIKNSTASNVLMYRQELGVEARTLNLDLAEKIYAEEGAGVKSAKSMFAHSHPFEWRICENLQGINLDFSYASVDDVLEKINSSAIKPYVLLAKLRAGNSLDNTIIKTPDNSMPVAVAAEDLRIQMLVEDALNDADDGLGSSFTPPI